MTAVCNALTFNSLDLESSFELMNSECFDGIEQNLLLQGVARNLLGAKPGGLGTEVPSEVQGQNIETPENTNGAVTKFDNTVTGACTPRPLWLRPCSADIMPKLVSCEDLVQWRESKKYIFVDNVTY